MEKSGIRETRWLFFILMISHISLEGIKTLVAKYATGAPSGIALSSLVCIGIVFLAEKYKVTKQDFCPQNNMEKKIYSAVALTLLIVTIFNTAGRMKEFSRAIGDTVLAESPGIFILLLMALATLAVGLIGHEATTRYASVVSLVFFVFLGLLIVTNISGAKGVNLCPVGGKNGLLNPFGGMYIFSDSVYFFFIGSWFQDNREIKYSLTKIIALTAIVVTGITFFYCLCVPYPASLVYNYPIFRLSVLANSSVLFQRFDGFVYLMWIFFSFISAGALVLFAVTIISETLGLKSKKALCPLIVLLCFLLSLQKGDFYGGTKIIMTLYSFVFVPFWVMFTKMRRRKNA